MREGRQRTGVPVRAAGIHRGSVMKGAEPVTAVWGGCSQILQTWPQPRTVRLRDQRISGVAGGGGGEGGSVSEGGGGGGGGGRHTGGGGGGRGDQNTCAQHQHERGD